MPRLIRMAPGAWIVPSTVQSVTAFAEDERLKVNPSVRLKAGPTEIGWSFDTFDKAVVFADYVARIVNDAETLPVSPKAIDINALLDELREVKPDPVSGKSTRSRQIAILRRVLLKP